jgi:uncharacterized protein YdeI (BOF family)
MNLTFSRFSYPVMWAFAIGLSSCAGPSLSETTKISAIQRQNADAMVSLSGKVKTKAPLLGQHAYEIQDETGTIWIITKDKAPDRGMAVQVRGKVRYQSILLAGKDQGSVYIEQQ